MRLTYVSALALFLFSCSEKDIYKEGDVLVVESSFLTEGLKEGESISVNIHDLYQLAEDRGLIELPDDFDSDLCGGSGSCQGTCPNGITMFLWGWNEGLCACSFQNGVLRVQCTPFACPILEIRCSGSSG